MIASAETEASEMEARDRLVTGIVDLVVERRRTVSTILSDPVIVGFFADHEEFRDDMHRLRRLLIADNAGPEARVRTAVLIAAISGAVMHPFVVDLDDDTLRAELLRLAHAFSTYQAERSVVNAVAAGTPRDGGSCLLHRIRRRSAS